MSLTDRPSSDMQVRVLSVLRLHEIDSVQQLQLQFEPEEYEPARRAFMDLIGDGVAIRRDDGIYAVATMPTARNVLTKDVVRDRILATLGKDGYASRTTILSRFGTPARDLVESVIAEMLDDGVIYPRSTGYANSSDRPHRIRRLPRLDPKIRDRIGRSGLEEGPWDGEAEFLSQSSRADRHEEDEAEDEARAQERLNESLARSVSAKAQTIESERIYKTLSRRIHAIVANGPVDLPTLTGYLPEGDRDQVVHIIVAMCGQGLLKAGPNLTYLVGDVDPASLPAERLAPLEHPALTALAAQDARESGVTLAEPPVSDGQRLEPPAPDLDAEFDEIEEVAPVEELTPPCLNPDEQNRRDLEWMMSEPMAAAAGEHFDAEETPASPAALSAAQPGEDDVEHAPDVALTPAAVRPVVTEEDHALLVRMTPGRAYNAANLQAQIDGDMDAAGALDRLIAAGSLTEIRIEDALAAAIRPTADAKVERPLLGLTPDDLMPGAEPIARIFTSGTIACGLRYLSRDEIAHIVLIEEGGDDVGVVLEAVDWLTEAGALQIVEGPAGEQAWLPGAALLAMIDLLDLYGETALIPTPQQTIDQGRAAARQAGSGDAAADDRGPADLASEGVDATLEAVEQKTVAPVSSDDSPASEDRAEASDGDSDEIAPPTSDEAIQAPPPVALDPVGGPAFDDLAARAEKATGPLAKDVALEAVIRRRVVEALDAAGVMTGQELKTKAAAPSLLDLRRSASELAAEARILAFDHDTYAPVGVAETAAPGRPFQPSSIAAALAGQTYVARQLAEHRRNPALKAIGAGPTTVAGMERAGVTRQRATDALETAFVLGHADRHEIEGSEPVYVAAGARFDATEFANGFTAQLAGAMQSGGVYRITDLATAAGIPAKIASMALEPICKTGALVILQNPAFVHLRASVPGAERAVPVEPVSMKRLHGADAAAVASVLRRTERMTLTEIAAALGGWPAGRTHEAVHVLVKGDAVEKIWKGAEAFHALTGPARELVELVDAPHPDELSDSHVLARMTPGYAYAMSVISKSTPDPGAFVSEISALEKAGFVQIKRFDGAGGVVLCVRKSRDEGEAGEPFPPVNLRDLFPDGIAELLTTLRAGPVATVPEIAGALGRPVGTVLEGLHDLVRKKALRQKGEGPDARYELTPSSMKLFALLDVASVDDGAGA